MAVVVGEGEVLEGEEGIIGTNNIKINSSSIIPNNRVVFLSLRGLMGLFLVGCLLLGLSRVLTPQFPPQQFGF